MSSLQHRIKRFLHHQAQTTPNPLIVDVDFAKGSYIYDKQGRAYLDFVAGVSACPLGHSHPKVVQAVQEQAARYMHVMVYGEYILDPALDYCEKLAAHLPKNLQTTYLVNSGAEAIEAALKLAKRYSGREEIISTHGAYHGNTAGAMSVMGNETYKTAYRPLLPGVRFIGFNVEEDLEKITSKTAAVLLESIQGAAGFIVPKKGYFKQVRERCEKVGALLILDEIQPGFGRTGKLFAFEHENISPDILVMGKAMAGGMPIGAITCSNSMMSVFKQQPKLGHITTFGGHPVIAAAALATLETILESRLMEEISVKEQLFRSLLVHPLIDSINGRGLMLAVLLKDARICAKVVERCLQKELIVFFLLYTDNAIRLSPPLTISEEEIQKGCGILIEVLNEMI